MWTTCFCGGEDAREKFELCVLYRVKVSMPVCIYDRFGSFWRGWTIHGHGFRLKYGIWPCARLRKARRNCIGCWSGDNYSSGLRTWYVDDTCHLWGTIQEFQFLSLTCIPGALILSGSPKFKSKIKFYLHNQLVRRDSILLYNGNFLRENKTMALFIPPPSICSGPILLQPLGKALNM